MNARELLKELVRHPSSEHDDPRPILDFAGGVGTGLGARATTVSNGDRPALLLSWGKPKVLFSGPPRHRAGLGDLEAVARHREGRQALRARYDRHEGGLRGDARLQPPGFAISGDFGILFTTDEETSMHGAEAAVAHGMLKETELVIVGEPTDLKPCLGQKGVLQMKVTTDGASGHASMPWAGKNAIARMGRILAAIAPLSGTDAASRAG
jgi:hypothetical protein